MVLLLCLSFSLPRCWLVRGPLQLWRSLFTWQFLFLEWGRATQDSGWGHAHPRLPVYEARVGNRLQGLTRHVRASGDFTVLPRCLLSRHSSGPPPSYLGTPSSFQSQSPCWVPSLGTRSALFRKLFSLAVARGENYSKTLCTELEKGPFALADL